MQYHQIIGVSHHSWFPAFTSVALLLLRAVLIIIAGTISSLLLLLLDVLKGAIAGIFPHLPLWIILVSIVIVIVLATTLGLWYERLTSTSEPSAADLRENRQIMLGRVQHKWIVGFLENPLYYSYEEQLLPVPLRERVGSRLDRMLSNPLEPTQTMPPGTTITQVFDQAGGELLILLDGLDEVAPSALSECIKTINEYYHQVHRSLVACSRTREFLDQPGRLALHTAVIVQPLSSEQVDTYLDGLAAKGEDVEGLKQTLHQSAALHTLATTPLFLTVLLLAYHGKPAQELLALVKAAPTDQPHLLFHNYVERTLQRKGTRLGLIFGLGAPLKHYTLRFWLWRTKCTPAPWRYVAFLDDAVEQLLLRKAGGGYIFRHRLLQDYFASLEVVSPQQLPGMYQPHEQKNGKDRTRSWL